MRYAAACVVIVAVCLNSDAGRLAGDTKLDLTVDPLRFLARALHLWNSQAFAGQLQNQAYGYLFPVGPFFALNPGRRPGWSAAVVVCVGVCGFSRHVRRPRLGVGRRRPVHRWPGLRRLAHLVTVLGAVSAEAHPCASRRGCWSRWSCEACAAPRGSPLRAGGAGHGGGEPPPWPRPWSRRLLDPPASVTVAGGLSRAGGGRGCRGDGMVGGSAAAAGPLQRRLPRPHRVGGDDDERHVSRRDAPRHSGLGGVRARGRLAGGAAVLDPERHPAELGVDRRAGPGRAGAERHATTSLGGSLPRCRGVHGRLRLPRRRRMGARPRRRPVRSALDGALAPAQHPQVRRRLPTAGPRRGASAPVGPNGPLDRERATARAPRRRSSR